MTTRTCVKCIAFWKGAEKDFPMSIIFGTRLPIGCVLEEEHLVQLAQATEPYAIDGSNVHCAGRIGMGFQSVQTHERSRLEQQPALDRYGNLLTFDGRLDNHKELERILGVQGDEIADSLIILSAFERWGEECFSRRRSALHP